VVAQPKVSFLDCEALKLDDCGATTGSHHGKVKPGKRLVGRDEDQKLEPLAKEPID